MIYCMSDIHGRKDKFDAMFGKSVSPDGGFTAPNLINFGPDDELYIIGDVIDRGPDGIELLLQIIVKWGKPETLIVGHTPVQFMDPKLMNKPRIWHDEKRNIMDIDCGCAFGLKSLAALGCVCLDTLEEFYV